jgi:hypothetical protein
MRITSGKYGAEIGEFWTVCHPPSFAGNTQAVIPDYATDCATESQMGKDVSLFSIASAPNMMPVQTPIQWVLGGLPPRGQRGRDLMLTTNLHLVPRLTLLTLKWRIG